MPPKTLPVRPTTDFAKESLFNILQNYVDMEEQKVLDLFAGTGNISFEFASRNCKHISSVDINQRCINFILQTCKNLKMENIKAIRANAFQFLKTTTQTYDIIFADPPYAHRDIMQIPIVVFEKKVLNPHGWLIVEHSAKTNLEQNMHFVEKRKYGNVQFSFFRNVTENS